MLLILLVAINVCCGIELKGSEHPYLQENHRRMEKHKPLPVRFHPLHFKRFEGVDAHKLPPRETVTITKTIVTEITKTLHKHPVCVKAPPGVPYCFSRPKIKATPIVTTLFQRPTKFIGVFGKSREACHKSHQRRERHHIIPPKELEHKAELFIKEFVTVTEIIKITKVESYVDCTMTASLIAENCIPVNEDMPPCPIKVVDHEYHYKPGIEHISIFGKQELEKRIDEEDRDITLFSDENYSKRTKSMWTTILMILIITFLIHYLYSCKTRFALLDQSQELGYCV